MKQLKLFKEERKTEFGGSLAKEGKRKEIRPLSLSAPIHLVLKAEDNIQLFQYSEEIKKRLETLSERHDVRIYKYAVHEDHIHCLLKFPHRQSYLAWIRGLTGTLSRTIPGLSWRLLPFTKILSWGNQFKKVTAYIERNKEEAAFLCWAWNEVKSFERDIYGKFGHEHAEPS